MRQKHYTIAEAVEQTRMSAPWFRKMIRLKRIKHLRIGGRVFITSDTIDSLLQDGIVEAE